MKFGTLLTALLMTQSLKTFRYRPKTKFLGRKLRFCGKKKRQKSVFFQQSVCPLFRSTRKRQQRRCAVSLRRWTSSSTGRSMLPTPSPRCRQVFNTRWRQKEFLLFSPGARVSDLAGALPPPASGRPGCPPRPSHDEHVDDLLDRGDLHDDQLQLDTALSHPAASKWSAATLFRTATSSERSSERSAWTTGSLWGCKPGEAQYWEPRVW